MSRCLGVGLLCLSLTACGQTADLVIQGGAVWTGLSSGAPQPGAVAIGGGKILAVGDSAAVARYLGARTRELTSPGNGSRAGIGTTPAGPGSRCRDTSGSIP